MQQLSGNLLEDALMAVNVMISTLRRNRMSVPDWVSEVGNRLDMESAMSSDGHRDDERGAESETDRFIPSGEAADILVMSPRHIGRLAHQGTLVGEKHGRYWYFRESAVREYAKENPRGAAL